MTAKRDIERWNRKVEDLLRQHGAVDVRREGKMYDWVLDTRFGALFVTVRPSERTRNGPGCVFCRFDDPPRLRELLPYVNPYSGEWNHHYYHGWSVKESLQDINHWLASVCVPLPKPPTPCPFCNGDREWSDNGIAICFFCGRSTKVSP